MRIIFSIIFCIALLSLVAMPNILYSKEGTLMDKQVSWLSDVQGWKAIGSLSPYNTNTIFNYMNGAAELYLAFNFRELKTIRFEKPGKPSIIVEVYEMASPEDAYGVFTFERQDPEVGIGQGSEFGGGLLRFWKGHTFVTIFGEEPDQDTEEAILILGRRIASSIIDSGNPPKILGYLPDKTLPFIKNYVWFFRSHIHLNQRFFVARANILLLTPDAEAVLARYDAGNRRMHILLVRYPTPFKTDAAVKSFKNAYMPEAGKSDAVRTENEKWTSMGRLNNFVVIIFDADDESSAISLINATMDILKGEGL